MGKKKEFDSIRFFSKVKSHRSELGQVSFLNFSSSKTIHRFARRKIRVDFFLPHLFQTPVCFNNKISRYSTRRKKRKEKERGNIKKFLRFNRIKLQKKLNFLILAIIPSFFKTLHSSVKQRKEENMLGHRKKERRRRAKKRELRRRNNKWEKGVRKWRVSRKEKNK